MRMANAAHAFGVAVTTGLTKSRRLPLRTQSRKTSRRNPQPASSSRGDRLR
jgi:hypothetical protein